MFRMRYVFRKMKVFKLVFSKIAKKEGHVESEVLIRYKFQDRTISFKAISNVSKVSSRIVNKFLVIKVQISSSKTVNYMKRLTRTSYGDSVVTCKKSSKQFLKTIY